MDIVYRTAQVEFERSQGEEIVTAVLSTEYPVQRSWGKEILDHSPTSVDLSRCDRGLPLLWNHDHSTIIGRAQNIRLDGRRLRADLRPASNEKAQEVWTDIRNGILKDISIGYSPDPESMVKEGENTFRFYRWSLYEASIITVPADPSSGVGRSLNFDSGGNFIMDRASEILALGRRAGMLPEALKHIETGGDVDSFKDLILAKTNPQPIFHVGRDRGELAPFRTFSEFLFCVRHAPGDPRLRPLFNDKVGEQYIKTVGHERALSMGVGSAGGFAVPSQFRPELLSVTPQTATIRPRATVIPAGSPPDAAISCPAWDQGTTHGVFAGFTGQWISEGYPKPETDVFLREVTLEPHEWAGTLIATDKLLRNWEAGSAMIERLARQALTGAEESAFISGNGVGRPLGFLNAACGAVLAVNRNAGNSIQWVDIYTMFSRLYGSRGIWLASPTTKTELIPMIDGASNLVWQPSARDGEPSVILGLPLFFDGRLPVLGSRGDICLVNLEYYLIKDGSGPFFGASDQVYYTSNRTVFKIFFNVDGQPWVSEPLPLEGSPANTVSPFVVLN